MAFPLADLRFLIRASVPLLAAASTACETGSRRPASPSVRDSAGIRIIENRAPAWNKRNRWRLSDTPRVQIGVQDGPPDYQLFGARQAHVQSDGAIVVANSGTLELRYFGAGGRHRITVGGRGGGPGEFEALTALLSLRADTVAAYDWRNQRVSVFAPDGAFIGSTKLAGPADPSARPVSRRPDGSWDVLHKLHYSRPLEGGFRDTLLLVRHRMDGAPGDTLGRFPGYKMFSWLTRVGDRQVVNFGIVRFSPTSFVAPRGEAYVVGTSDTYDICVYDAAGQLRSVIRRPYVARAITPEDIRRAVASRLEGVADEGRRSFMKAYYEKLPSEETAPALAAIKVDEAGNLWVLEYPMTGDDARTWTVFDLTGAWLGDVRMPAGFQLIEAGRDYALGRWKDEMNVEYIQVYGLIKP